MKMMLLTAAVGLWFGEAGVGAEAGKVETAPLAPLKMTIKRAGGGDVQGSGAIAGGGIRFVENQGVTTGGDKFIQHSSGQRDWQPLDFSFQVAPRGTYKFNVDVFPNTTAVSGIRMRIPRIPASSGTDVNTKAYRPGRPAFANVTFTIGKADHRAARDWMRMVNEGKEARKDIAIVVTTGAEVRRIVLRSAVPVAWETVDARTETVEVRVQSLQVSGKQLAPLLVWLSDTIEGKDWRGDLVYRPEAEPVEYTGSFLTEYSLSLLERDELRETWQIQPADVKGMF